MRVWIAQCLCPRRHCILAAVDQIEGGTGEAERVVVIVDTLQAQVEGLIANQTLNPWCGLCKAPASDWHYEVGPTRWATMAEALPTLRQTEDSQIATMSAMDDPAGTA